MFLICWELLVLGVNHPGLVDINHFSVNIDADSKAHHSDIRAGILRDTKL